MRTLFISNISLLMSDPMEIIYNTRTHAVADYTGFQLTEIAFLLQVAGLLACIISICWCLIKLLFEHNPQQVAEEKAEITHKFYIILLIGSFVFLFNFAFKVVESFF